MNRWHLINLSLSLLLLLISQSLLAQPKFIGNEKCGSCHKVDFASWEVSSHAKAFNILKPGKRKAAKKLADLNPDKDYTHDKKCIKCHVTGYKKKGGFKSIEKTPEMAGVGCESCHGPGGEYRDLHEDSPYGFEKNAAEPLGQVYGEDDEAVCKACHGHEDAPHHEGLDQKYQFNWQAALKQQESYHIKKSGKSQFSF